MAGGRRQEASFVCQFDHNWKRLWTLFGLIVFHLYQQIVQIACFGEKGSDFLIGPLIDLLSGESNPIAASSCASLLPATYSP
mmetsp:Transcript_26211/g.44615  ORF Transcript_26211/g.44615 Transcript_26211/m.44615 type:complete len:82 (-) Transcript_26211:486-731(-)